jgi:hypothetical protein
MNTTKPTLKFQLDILEMINPNDVNDSMKLIINHYLTAIA